MTDLHDDALRFRAKLAGLNLTQSDFARQLMDFGDRRTFKIILRNVSAYATGARKVPAEVEVICNLLALVEEFVSATKATVIEQNAVNSRIRRERRAEAAAPEAPPRPRTTKRGATAKGIRMQGLDGLHCHFCGESLAESGARWLVLSCSDGGWYATDAEADATGCNQGGFSFGPACATRALRETAEANAARQPQSP